MIKMKTPKPEAEKKTRRKSRRLSQPDFIRVVDWLRGYQKELATGNYSPLIVAGSASANLNIGISTLQIQKAADAAGIEWTWTKSKKEPKPKKLTKAERLAALEEENAQLRIQLNACGISTIR